MALTWELSDRRSGEAAEGTQQRSCWSVPLDRNVIRLHLYPPFKYRHYYRRTDIWEAQMANRACQV